MVSVYPASNRSAWILSQRGGDRRLLDPWAAPVSLLERERAVSGEIASSGVVLLTNKECPWRCLMCDLWKGTTTEPAPEGAVAHQVGLACEAWEKAGATPSQVKLYNSGSFFDPSAIPRADYAPIAARVSFARNVVVESHPKLVGKDTARLRDLLDGTLEVAMGLETAHPAALEKLNKGFDLEKFAAAATWLRSEGIAMRAFVLVGAPFVPQGEARDWAVRSADFAFECGATAVSLIATRSGNGAMDRLLEAGEFTPPTLGDLERAQSGAVALGKGRVFADVWDLAQSTRCPECLGARQARLEDINLGQKDLPQVQCSACGGS